MFNEIVIFLAGGLLGGLLTFLLLRSRQNRPVKTARTDPTPIAPSEPLSANDSDNTGAQEPGRLGDLHAQHLEAAARIRDQRAASRAARESQRIAAETAALREAQRLAAEEEVRIEVERIAAEAQVARDAKRIVGEEAARREAQRIAAEELEYQQAQRVAAEVQAAREAQHAASVEATRREVQRIAAEEKARHEAERAAAETHSALEAQRIAAEQEALLEAQRAAADEAARLEATRLAAEAEASREEQRIADEEDAAQKVQEAAKPVTPKPPSEAIIMIVDDSKVGRIKTNRFIVNNQFQSQMAEDGCDALDKIAAKMPDIVITDVEMPNMDGFELTKNIRSNPLTAHIPVIVISGNSDGYEEKAREVGADLILGKPYSETQMIEQIHGFLRNGRQSKGD